MPTPDELTETWITLGVLYQQAMRGDLVDRGYDTATALRQAQDTVFTVITREIGDDPGVVQKLYDGLAERIAVSQD
jgi:hypothetical protein